LIELIHYIIHHKNMPKAPKLDLERLWEKLRLTLRQQPHGGGELRRALQVSQPTLSLLIKKHKEELFIIGKTKSATYALPREMPGLPHQIHVYTIDANGKGNKAGTLHPVFPGESFHWECKQKKESKFYSGLPYFLEDLRPAGYLGALIPRLHPELGGPQDITKWNTNQCLGYLTRFGSDLIGNFILGEEAYSRFLKQQEKPALVESEMRAENYEISASDVLALGDPGSSAAGEQPKFLITKTPHTKVIVKFSPKKEDARARRYSDLLWCEGLALQALHNRGFAVESWEVIEGKKRTFLEVERFDRLGKLGRRGMISLQSLDLEFVGNGEDWSATSEALLKQKKISGSDFEKIQCLDLFGALIANSVRHLGNLSFFIESDGKFSLAPIYDMLPMLYNPKMEVVDREFTPPQPTPSLAATWRIALPAAVEFWTLASEHKHINREFRAIAEKNRQILLPFENLVATLPE
jgi:hypothetical protein